MKPKHQLLDIKSVEFDDENPRIAHYLEAYDQVSPELIALTLQPNDTKFVELKQAIKSNGGLVNPIIVNQRDGKNIAIEGNTRLAIFKMLHEEEPNGGQWTHIPSIVYENMDQAAIDAVRLQVHLVGVRSWGPFAKAKYLYMLHEKKRLPLSDLVDFCGGNKNEVIRNIAAYKDMMKFYKPMVADENFEKNNFSAFKEAQNHRIKEALMSHGYTAQDFATWVKDKKFEPRLESVRMLDKILNNERAHKAFLETNAQNAERLIDRPSIVTDLANNKLSDLCSALVEKLKHLELAETQRIRKDPDAIQSVQSAALRLTSLYEEELEKYDEEY